MLAEGARIGRHRISIRACLHTPEEVELILHSLLHSAEVHGNVWRVGDKPSVRPCVL